MPGGAGGSGWGLGSGLRHYRGSAASWEPLGSKSDLCQLAAGAWVPHTLPPGEGTDDHREQL